MEIKSINLFLKIHHKKLTKVIHTDAMTLQKKMQLKGFITKPVHVFLQKNKNTI